MAEEKTELETAVAELQAEVDAEVEKKTAAAKEAGKAVQYDNPTLEGWHLKIAELERKANALAAPPPAPHVPGQAELKALRKRVYAL